MAAVVKWILKVHLLPGEERCPLIIKRRCIIAMFAWKLACPAELVIWYTLIISARLIGWRAWLTEFPRCRICCLTCLSRACVSMLSGYVCNGQSCTRGCERWLALVDGCATADMFESFQVLVVCNFWRFCYGDDFSSSFLFIPLVFVELVQHLQLAILVPTKKKKKKRERQETNLSATWHARNASLRLLRENCFKCEKYLRENHKSSWSSRRKKN